MHVVYYYVLIKLPGREIGAVLALHKHDQATRQKDAEILSDRSRNHEFTLGQLKSPWLARGLSRASLNSGPAQPARPTSPHDAGDESPLCIPPVLGRRKDFPVGLFVT